jgi:hypothetical protein
MGSGFVTVTPYVVASVEFTSWLPNAILPGDIVTLC